MREPDYERAPDAVIIASGPLTSDALAQWISGIAGADNLAFFDAAAPIVAADSLDESILFRQSRYEKDAPGDYRSRAIHTRRSSTRSCLRSASS